jgi:hypothetical protein
MKRVLIVVACLLPWTPFIALWLNNSTLSPDGARIEQLQSVTLEQLEALPIGSEVLIEGQIDPRTPAQFRSFVAYVREDPMIDNDLSIYWSRAEQVAPPLWIELAGSLVRVINRDYELQRPTTTWPPGNSGRASSRWAGLQAGDPVIASGRLVSKADGYEITANLVAGGTRAEFVAAYQAVIGASIGLAATGVALALLAGLAVFMARRRNARVSQVAA